MKIEWVPLGSVLEMNRKPITIEASETYRRIGIYSWGRGMLRRGPSSAADMGSMKYFTFPQPSLVFSNIQAWEGAVALAGPDDAGYVCSSRFYPYVPRADARVSLRYLLEFFRSEVGLSIMRKASPGTQVRNKVLSRNGLEASKVPLPSLSDQERIASHLGKLGPTNGASTIDSGVIVEHLISAAAHRAHRARLGELLRSHRPWMEIEGSGSYRAIGVRGFGRGMIRYPEGGAETLSKMRYYPIEPGALIVSNIKSWEGAVCVAAETDTGRIASNRFLQYIPKDPRITTGWVEQYLLSPAGLASLNAASPGSADRNRTLSMAAFEAIEIPVPPPKTQESVMRVVRALRGVTAEQTRRDELAAAVLPAARNEIFNSMR